MTDSQNIDNPAPDWKYYHTMLNMTDDELDPYEYRLLGHYRRRGTCTEAIATTSESCHMSLSKIRSTRKTLEKKGYIAVKQIEGIGTRITIVDKMQENVERYATPIKSDTPIKNGRGKKTEPLSDLKGEPLSDLIPKEQPIEEQHNTNIPGVPSYAELQAKLDNAEKRIAELEALVKASLESTLKKPSKESSKSKSKPSLEEKHSEQVKSETPHNGIFDAVSALYVPPGQPLNGYGGWVGAIIQIMRQAKPELTEQDARDFIAWWKSNDKLAAKYRDKDKIRCIFADWMGSKPRQPDFIVQPDGTEKMIWSR